VKAIDNYLSLLLQQRVSPGNEKCQPLNKCLIFVLKNKPLLKRAQLCNKHLLMAFAPAVVQIKSHKYQSSEQNEIKKLHKGAPFVLE
jgi:hypothetical protein